MKGLIGYLKKVIWIFNILLFLTIPFSNKLDASDFLSSETTFSHNIKDNGSVDTTVTLTISSTKRFVLTYYSVTIPQRYIKPEIYSLNRSKKLEATLYDRSNSTDILIDLENSVVTPESPVSVRLTYTQKYSDKNILELISQVEETLTSKVSITYPRTWGEIVWISDQITDLKRTDDSYIVTISKPNTRFVRLIFDQGIVYSFKISKSLNNPTQETNQYELLIPPDTNFQQIILNNINTMPSEAFVDENGNYILIFTIDAETQKDIKIDGHILMGYREYYPKPQFISPKRNNIYWVLDSKHINRVEEYLRKNGINDSHEKEVLIEYLYRYVIERLTPSTLPTTLAGGVRRNAIQVFENPTESTPEDYADLLKALLSYYEIPTRYTIGYVSDISSYQNKGMFHHWIQAFDGNRWLLLDPFLEDKYNVSLLGKEQFDHITILNRTSDSISPTLPYYSDNDIMIEYLPDYDIEYLPSANASISLEPYSVFNKYLYGKITIENTGNSILTKFFLNDCQPDLNKYLDNVINSSDTILSPHMNKSLNFHIPISDMKEDLIFCSVEMKNGNIPILTELASTNYQVSEKTSYEFLTKIVSFSIFAVFACALYLFIDKIIYKDE